MRLTNVVEHCPDPRKTFEVFTLFQLTKLSMFYIKHLNPVEASLSIVVRENADLR